MSNTTEPRKTTIAHIRSGHTGPFFSNCRGKAKILPEVWAGKDCQYFLTMESTHFRGTGAASVWVPEGLTIFIVWEHRPDEQSITIAPWMDDVTNRFEDKQHARDYAWALAYNNLKDGLNAQERRRQEKEARNAGK